MANQALTRASDKGNPESTSADERPRVHASVRITQGQLDAVAMRCLEELRVSLGREGSTTVAQLDNDLLTVDVKQSFSAAERKLVSDATGCAFFSMYIGRLMAQLYPELTRHVEHILPFEVKHIEVKTQCEMELISFCFGIHPRPSGE